MFKFIKNIKQKLIILVIMLTIPFISSCSMLEGFIGGIGSNTSPNATFDVNLPYLVPEYDETSLQIHYQRYDNTYAPWALWIWNDDIGGNQVEFNYRERSFVIASYSLSSLGFDPSTEPIIWFKIVRTEGEGEIQDVFVDRYIDCTKLQKDSNNVYHIYLFQRDTAVYKSANKDILVPALKCPEFIVSDIITTSTTIEGRITVNDPLGDVGAYRARIRKGDEVVAVGTGWVGSGYNSGFIFEGFKPDTEYIIEILYISSYDDFENEKVYDEMFKCHTKKS